MHPPSEIVKICSTAAGAKTRLKIGKMFVLAMFAGFFIGFGALGSTIAGCRVESPAIARILSAAVFPIGLMMVLCAGAELFTGNSLITVTLLDRKCTVWAMLRNWLVVFLGNFAGSVLLAAIVVYGHTYSMPAFGHDVLPATAVATARAKCSLSFGDAFLRGILCNFLVCIAVWIGYSAKDLAGKAIGIMLPIFMFVLCGFEHCVANMYFVPAGIFAAAEYGIDPGNASWTAFLCKNLLPVTLGNIVGGALLVAAGYHYAYSAPPPPPPKKPSPFAGCK